MGRALPSSLSPSSISSFKECPLAFRFSYLERLPEPPSPWATKGTLVHRALELLMCRPAAERTIDAALADLDRARAELADTPSSPSLELTDEEWALFHADAAGARPPLLRARGPDDRAPDRPRAEARGRARRRCASAASSTGSSSTTTASSSSPTTRPARCPSELFEAKSLGGVHMYALLCERDARPASGAGAAAIPVEARGDHRDADRAVGAAASQRKTAALWSAIERACARDDFRPHPGRLCDFCTFKPYCPAYGGDPEQAAELRGPGTVIAPALPLAGV